MLSLLTPALIFACSSQALVARANLPPTFNSGSEVQTTSSNLSNVFRDGGGGGTVGGKNIMVFCDTTTTQGGPTGQMVGFTSNSIAYSDPSNPSSLSDFGTLFPNLAIPFLDNETAMTNDLWDSQGVRVVLWPGSSIAPVDSSTGIFVAPVSTYTTKLTSAPLYNTLVAIKTSTDSEPVLTRTVPQLFYPNEIQYGSFGTLLNQQTNLLNFFAVDGGNLKLAQAPPSSYSNRASWQYWNGQIFTSTPPALGDTASNIVQDNFSSGDVFYSSYYGTYLLIYMNSNGDNTFWLRYSMSGNVQGPWSESQKLYTTEAGTEINYAGHAYPSWDASGKTVTLSWSYSGMYTRMTTITFN